jgi:hypothetical protein
MERSILSQIDPKSLIKNNIQSKSLTQTDPDIDFNPESLINPAPNPDEANNPTGKHEIPIISEIFSQGFRLRLAGSNT